MTAVIPTAESLTHLLRLLDDETPEVRESVAEALKAFEGDVSELLSETGFQASSKESKLLSELLLPSRRERLRRDWIVPAKGIVALNDDWENLEALLRSLSDYLHDGVTIRQPLGDALDLLSEELEPSFRESGWQGLISDLLGKQRLKADTSGELNPAHYELASVCGGQASNSLGLGLILLLVAQRLQADISGINLPGGFFCRIEPSPEGTLLDPAAGGKTISPGEFAHRIRRYPREVRQLASRPASPGELLLRTTEELATAFAVINRNEDAELMEELVESLIPSN